MERYKRPCVMHLPSLPLGLDPLFRVRSYPVRHWQDSLYPECGVAPPFRVRRFPCRFVMSAIPAIDQQHELISRLSDVSSFSRITATHLLENGLTLYCTTQIWRVDSFQRSDEISLHIAEECPKEKKQFRLLLAHTWTQYNL